MQVKDTTNNLYIHISLPPQYSDVIRPSPSCPRCPGGQVTVTDESGQQRCVPSPCGSTSCRNGGVCQALSPDSYRCRCQEGFRGQRCELGQVKGHRLAALSPSSILAISMCLLVFFGKKQGSSLPTKTTKRNFVHSFSSLDTERPAGRRLRIWFKDEVT